MLFHRPTLSLGNKTDKALKHYMEGHKNSVSAFQSGAWGNSYNVMQSSWIKCFQFLCLCLQNILFQLFISFIFFLQERKFSLQNDFFSYKSNSLKKNISFRKFLTRASTGHPKAENTDSLLRTHKVIIFSFPHIQKLNHHICTFT